MTATKIQCAVGVLLLALSSISAATPKYGVQRSPEALAFHVAPIKSSEDLRAFQTMVIGAQNPLNQLSPAGRKRFVESITFNERGVTSFNYSDLKRELSPDQLERVLALFGSQHTGAAIKQMGDSSVATASIGDCNDPDMPQISDCSGGDLGGGGGGGGWGGWGEWGGGGGGGGGVVTLPPPQPIPSGNDYRHMYCPERATCAPKVDYICMKTC